jgi:hypothetical protein
MDLKQARINLFQDIQPNSYKRLLQKHIKKYPCDKNLSILLEFNYKQVLQIPLTNDIYLFQNITFNEISNSSVIEKTKEFISNNEKPNISSKEIKEIKISETINIYFIKFFELLEKKYKSKSMSELYENILELEKMISYPHCISFYFKFIINNPFIYYLSPKILLDYINTFSNNSNIKLFIDSFKLNYDNYLLKNLIENKDEEGVLKLMKNITIDFERYKVDIFSYNDIINIYQDSKLYNLNFFQYISIYKSQHQKKLQLIILKTNSSKEFLLPHEYIIVPFIELPKPITLPFKSYKTHSYYHIQFYITEIPLWISCHQFLIKEINNEKKSKYNLNESLIKGYYYPNQLFYNNFIIHEDCQQEDIYINSKNDKFKILYINENNEIINYSNNKFKKWIKQPKIKNYEYYKNKKLTELYGIEIMFDILKNIIIESLNYINENLDKTIIYELIIKQIDINNLKLIEIIKIIFDFVSKINPNYNLKSCHLSFNYKINNLYYNFENILELPKEYSFPEYYLLSDIEIYNNHYLSCLDIFIKNIIIKYNTQLYKYSFPLEEYPDCHLQLKMMNEYIWNNQLILLKESEIMNEKYFNKEIIEEGYDNIGIFIDVPFYLKKKLDSNVKNIEIKQMIDFETFLESIKEPLILNQEIEENKDDEELEEYENIDEDDKLEEEEIDLNDFNLNEE